MAAAAVDDRGVEHTAGSKPAALCFRRKPVAMVRRRKVFRVNLKVRQIRGGGAAARTTEVGTAPRGDSESEIIMIMMRLQQQKPCVCCKTEQAHLSAASASDCRDCDEDRASFHRHVVDHALLVTQSGSH